MPKVQIIPGLQIVANGKLAIVIGPVGEDSISVSYVASSHVESVSLENVEFLRPAGGDNVVFHTQELSQRVARASLKDLQDAENRFEIIKRWRAKELSAIQAASMIGVSASQVYKINAQFSTDVGPNSTLSLARGRRPGFRSLDPKIDKIIEDSVTAYKGKAATYSAMWREVESSCIEQKLPKPSRGTVTRRLKALLTGKELLQAKEGAEPANQRFGSRPGKKITSSPLEWVQMDHTLVDIILLADDRINAIGRPWLTVVLDMHTRVLLGYYLSLHVPSALSVACALTHAILPKIDFSKKYDITVGDYPFYGVPNVLHMDNATEFKSPKFQRACSNSGITPIWRPIGKKHYGGHVERVIGTFMTTKVHFLKGTTMSNAVARRGVNSETSATMTFSEFSAWFAREVVLYHSTVHTELRMSPREKWHEHFGPRGISPFPPRVDSPLQFKLKFMPEDTRTIGNAGIEFKGRKYWEPLLSQYVGTRNVEIKFDPFTMRQIWVKIDNRYQQINSLDLTAADTTFEEYRASKFHREAINPGSLADEGLVQLRRENQSLTKKAGKDTRAARRKNAAEKAYARDQILPNRPPVAEKKEKPNYSEVPLKFKGSGDSDG